MKNKLVIIAVAVIFAVTLLSLIPANSQLNSISSALSVEMAVAHHACDGDSCHAYDVGGTIKCDACCTSGGTPDCSRMAGCGCTPPVPE